MLESDLYYKKINQTSTFLYDYCNSAIKNLSEDKRKDLPYLADFRSVRINKDIFLKDSVLKKINDKFDIQLASILILEKNIGINFHVDSFRKVTINMLLSSGISHSVFKEREKLDNPYQFKLQELIFEEKFFYLYNVSEEHCVLNFDKPRFMFSLKFRDGDLTYNEVFDWCKENNMFESTYNE